MTTKLSYANNLTLLLTNNESQNLRQLPIQQTRKRMQMYHKSQLKSMSMQISKESVLTTKLISCLSKSLIESINKKHLQVFKNLKACRAWKGASRAARKGTLLKTRMFWQVSHIRVCIVREIQAQKTRTISVLLQATTTRVVLVYMMAASL